MTAEFGETSRMAVLIRFRPLSSFIFSSNSAVSSIPTSVFMSVAKPYFVESECEIGYCNNRRRSSATFEVCSRFSDAGEFDSESDDADEAFEDELAVAPKLQRRLEQKMKMKFEKKIRLRRKKLIRKRRMRKRGRLPPSKLKK